MYKDRSNVLNFGNIFEEKIYKICYLIQWARGYNVTLIKYINDYW